MTSTASLKDLSKAVCAYLLALSTTSLPHDLSSTIEIYLARCKPSEDSAALDRLQDELVFLFQKYVQGQPDRYASFLAVLRPLKPAMKTQTRLLYWWNSLVEPLLGQLDGARIPVHEDLASYLDVWIDSEDQTSTDDAPATTSASNPFMVMLIDKWMYLSEAARDAGARAAEGKERLIHDALVTLGRTNLRAFFIALDTFFSRAACRSRSLTLLCDLVRNQPPHLHAILNTPLFSHILDCLKNDTSTTILTMALVALVMLLPQMPSSLVPFLPTLFNIYTRMLFWNGSNISSPVHTAPYLGDGAVEAEDVATWDACLFNPDADQDSISYLTAYFTILYGLYPLNFMDYVRKPQRYLRHANSLEDVDIEPAAMRDRSERLRMLHLLHPNFCNLTVETELTDFSRWVKSEPDDVVASCMTLYVGDDEDPPRLNTVQDFILRHGNDGGESDVGGRGCGGSSLASSQLSSPTSLPMMGQLNSPDTRSWDGGPSPASPAPSQPRGPRGNSVSSQPSVVAGAYDDVTEDSPTLPPDLMMFPSRPPQSGRGHPNHRIESASHESHALDEIPALSLSDHQLVSSRIKPLEEKGSSLRSQPNRSMPTTASSTENMLRGHVARLYHQIILLQNDLTFERYMKQQHVAHIGALRRKQLREAATEAEMQNLIITNRNLKLQLDESKRAEAQTKKEADHRRTISTKWEAELAGKCRALRDEQKTWDAERERLNLDLDAARCEMGKLQEVVRGLEISENQTRQQLEAVDLDVEELERLRVEVARLSATERALHEKERLLEAAVQAAAEAQGQSEMLTHRLAAKDEEMQHMRNLYETQIIVLNSKYAKLQQEREIHGTADVQAMYQRLLQASEAKQTELEKKYAALMRKSAALQSSLFDFQHDRKCGKTREPRPGADDGHATSPPPRSGSVRPRGLSHDAAEPEPPVPSTETFAAHATTMTTTPLLGSSHGSTTTGSGMYSNASSPAGHVNMTEMLTTGPTNSQTASTKRHHGRGKFLGYF